MFMVFIDLALAARKDRELAAIFRPAQRIFRQECYYTALDLFPEWLKQRDQLRTAIDLSLYMMEGMVLDDLSPDGDNAARLLNFLAQELDVLRAHGAKAENRVETNAMSRETPEHLVPLFREWIELLFKFEELQKLKKLKRGRHSSGLNIED